MLEVRGLTHRYGDREVLRNVSFTVPDGCLTGFVGANGAGKTTAMRAILGLIHPTAGEVFVNGTPITADDRARIGYMPEERGLYPKMRLREQIVYFARLHGFTKADAITRADALIDRVGLAERADDEVASLSLGNQQRAQICAALVHDPSILILDEPFSGLDPVAVDVVLEVLQERADAGAPVLFSSHQLDVVERLSKEIVIIADGEVRAAGRNEQLRADYSKGRYRLRLADASWLTERPGMQIVSREGDDLIVVFEGADADAQAQTLLREAIERGPVLNFSRDLVPLASIFREVR